MRIDNYKLELYTPNNEYRGILVADNVEANIRIGDTSTISFSIPEYINGKVNERLHEILDNFRVMLTYGDKDAPEKHYFILAATPMEFSEAGYKYRYTGNSYDFNLDKKQVKEWMGVKKENYYHKYTPKLTEYSSTKRVKISNSKVKNEDLSIYEVREKSNISNKSMLIEVENASSIYWGIGAYYLEKSGEELFAVIKMRDNEDKTGYDDSIKVLDKYYFKIYDNPTNREYYVGYQGSLRGYVTEEETNLEDTGEVVDIEGVEYFLETYYTKDGLQLTEVWESLPKTEWELVISEADNAEYRSSLDFNNLTMLQIVKQLAEKYKLEYFFNSNERKLFMFKTGNFGRNKGLNLTYGSYLKSVVKDINAATVVTAITGVGKDGITTAMISPTGDYWEDYTYYLDHVAPEFLGSTINNINGPSGIVLTGADEALSRWMKKEQAINITKWQIARDVVHKIFLGEIEPVPPLNTNHFNLYQKRKNLISTLTKEENKYFEIYAKSFEYKVLWEATLRYAETLSGAAQTEEKAFADKYKTLYDNYNGQATTQQAKLNQMTQNIYDEKISGSNAFYFQEVRNLLKKEKWDIDELLLEPFRKEYVYQETAADDEESLLKGMFESIEENKKPKVTIDMGIVDILAAQDAKFDHDKLGIGDKVYLYFPEFNINQESQIKEVNISFDDNNISVVLSTIKNYEKGIGNRLANSIMRLTEQNKNIVVPNNDVGKSAKFTGSTFYELVTKGLKTGQTNVLSGITSPDGSTSVKMDGEGLTTYDVKVDHETETVEINQETDSSRILIGNGSITITNDRNSIEMSVQKGFEIRNKNNEKVFSADQNGNISFKGVISQDSVFTTPWGNSSVGDMLTFSNNVIGGSRTIVYQPDPDNEGQFINPAPSIANFTPFIASPSVGLNPWLNVNYRWSSSGLLQGSGNANSFKPTSITQVTTTPSETMVTLEIDYYSDAAKTQFLKTVTNTFSIAIVFGGESGAPGQDGQPGQPGAAGTNAKTGRLFANLYSVTYNGDGVIISPSNSQIILTAQSFNFVNVRYRFLKGTVQKQAIGTLNSYTILAADLPANTAQDTWTVEFYENGSDTVIAKDTVSIFGVKDGSEVYYLQTSRDAVVLAAQPDGSVPAGTTVELSTQLLKGSSEPSGVTYSWTTNIPAVTVSGANTKNATFNNLGNYDTILVTITATHGTKAVSKNINITRAKKGDVGAPGEKGDKGNGVIYKGIWSSVTTYVSNENTTDVVSRKNQNTNNYSFYFLRKPTSLNQNPDNNSTGADPVWVLMNSFGSVATDILLTKDAYIDRTLNIGTFKGANEETSVISMFGDPLNPYISLGQSTKAYNSDGIYLGFHQDTNGLNRGAKFSLTNSNGNFLRWTGNALEIKSPNFQLNADGNITASNVNLSGIISAKDGEIGGWTIGAHRLQSGNSIIQSESGGETALQFGSDNSEFFKVTHDGSVRMSRTYINNTSSTARGWMIDSLDSDIHIIGRNDISNESRFVDITQSGLYFQHDYSSSSHRSHITTDQVSLGYWATNGNYSSELQLKSDGRIIFKETRSSIDGLTIDSLTGVKMLRNLKNKTTGARIMEHMVGLRTFNTQYSGSHWFEMNVGEYRLVFMYGKTATSNQNGVRTVTHNLGNNATYQVILSPAISDSDAGDWYWGIEGVRIGQLKKNANNFTFNANATSGSVKAYYFNYILIAKIFTPVVEEG